MFRSHAEGIIISLHVIPNAPKNEIIGIYNNHLKIKIKAPPVEGKANEEIISLFKQILNISKNKIELLSGEKSKNKSVLIRGWTQEQLQSHLLKNSN